MPDTAQLVMNTGPILALIGALGTAGDLTAEAGRRGIREIRAIGGHSPLFGSPAQPAVAAGRGKRTGRNSAEGAGLGCEMGEDRG